MAIEATNVNVHEFPPPAVAPLPPDPGAEAAPPPPFIVTPAADIAAPTTPLAQAPEEAPPVTPENERGGELNVTA